MIRTKPRASLARQASFWDFLPCPEAAGGSCTRCESRVGARSRFCLECGRTLKRAERCSACGSILGPGGRYCYECGLPVSGSCASDWQAG